MNKAFTPTARITTNYQDSFEKGRLFEEYISNLFTETFFYRKQLRKSKKFDETYYINDSYFPDIEMELVFTGKRNYRFAVECKWRRNFKNGKIHWADDNKICTYRMFQDRVRVPVFVAIGIGGEPDNPEKLFLTPLNNIYMKNELFESDLNPFERNPRRRFYYDYRQLTLL